MVNSAIRTGELDAVCRPLLRNDGPRQCRPMVFGIRIFRPASPSAWRLLKLGLKRIKLAPAIVDQAHLNGFSCGKASKRGAAHDFDCYNTLVEG